MACGAILARETPSAPACSIGTNLQTTMELVGLFLVLENRLWCVGPAEKERVARLSRGGQLAHLELRRARFFDSGSRWSQKQDLLAANFWTKCPEKPPKGHSHHEHDDPLEAASPGWLGPASVAFTDQKRTASSGGASREDRAISS
jgi:hypothetical protein